jgi:streptogramin lyase
MMSMKLLGGLNMKCRSTMFGYCASIVIALAAALSPTATPAVDQPDDASGTPPMPTQAIDCKRIVAVAIADETTKWVACGVSRRSRMLRIDPRDNHVVAEIPIKQGSHFIVVEDDAVWVTYGTYRQGLHRIDPVTNKMVDTIRIKEGLGGFITSLAADRDALWIADTDGWVTRLDKRTGQEEASIHVRGGSAALVAGEGAIWVLSTTAGTLSQIDPHANRIVRTIPIGISCEALAGPCHHGPVFAAGSVWVASYIEETVSRIDPESGRVAVTIPVGAGPTSVAAADGSIWINRVDGNLLRIDPQTNQVVERIALNPASKGADHAVAAGEFDPPAVHSPLPETPARDDPVLESADADPGAPEYRMAGESVDLEFLTPPVVRTLAMRDETNAHEKHMGITRFTPGKDFFRWSEYGDGSASVVVIQAIPKIKKFSRWALGDLEAIFNPKDRSLEPSFRFMRLLRDGSEVTPIDSRKPCDVFKIKMLYPEGDKKWQDQVYGCYGSYAYDPATFASGATFTLQVFTEGESEPESFTLSERTIDRIRSDFQGPAH